MSFSLHELIDQLPYAAYAVSLVAVFVIYLRRQKKKHKRSLSTLQKATEAGLTEPPSLHPVIDPNRCLGAGSCVDACPEGDILGMIHGKAELIEPTHCIGHGACKTACPHDAITLVFGTEKRGIDIPFVSPSFETNVPGIFIAGELGGMGLIRNAIEQGRQAMEAVRQYKGKVSGHDVVIVGAGPAGFSASLGAMQHKLRYVTVEQDSLGGTVSHYPRGKIVMTQPVTLPMVGKVKTRETTKEALLGFWQGVEKKTGVKINYKERVEEVTKNGNGFVVKTTRKTYETGAILLTIGRRGTPRKLGVPGEELSKVVYRLIDPAQYRNQHVLVVGGGDAALEAAHSIADEPGTTVTLSYRSDSFSRAKLKNRQKVEERQAANRLRVMLSSNVKTITEKKVLIEHEGNSVEIPNDGVIICAGGVLPTPFLKKIGIEVETKHGTA
ncbi:MAG: NAD(P)-binding domain-containing protein [Gammaproteobacteria bacterium]|nr:NAD(P)-binding domain-containing protein [Gammaproteobacteria bacterium]